MVLLLLGEERVSKFFVKIFLHILCVGQLPHTSTNSEQCDYLWLIFGSETRMQLGLGLLTSPFSTRMMTRIKFFRE